MKLNQALILTVTLTLDSSLLGAIGNALYESSGRSSDRPMYAYY